MRYHSPKSGGEQISFKEGQNDTYYIAGVSITASPFLVSMRKGVEDLCLVDPIDEYAGEPGEHRLHASAPKDIMLKAPSLQVFKKKVDWKC